MRKWLAAAGGVLILILFAWYFLHSSSQPRENAANGPVSTLATPETPRQGNTLTTTTSPISTKNSATASTRPADAGREQWRVVAFTYNREDQARKKVHTIATRHPALSPDVFSPTGRAPFLVTLGGPMTHDQAAAFLQKARTQGLPSDVYIQNYSR
jgi:hypothetical protein